jgi:hypothetical protein
VLVPSVSIMRTSIVVVALLASTAARADDLAITAHAEPHPHRRWVRLALETAGLFAVGQGWYWRHGASTNSGDWELPGNWSAIDRKLTGDGFRFDGDGFVTNAIKHPVFGATSYVLARENGFGRAGAFAVATLTSGLWETFGEWREFGSINDMLTTSTSGVPIGEAFYGIAHHLRETRWNVFAAAGQRGTRDIAALGMRAAYGRDGIQLEVPFDRRMRDFEAHAMVAGTQRDELFAGVRTNYIYHQVMERADDPTWDVDAAVAVGPSLAYDTRGDLAVHVGIDAGVQFAMLRSWAFAPWRMQHPDAVVRGALQTNAHPYYYGAALVLSPQASVTYRDVTLGVALDAREVSSLDGHDRYRDMLVDDPHLSDTDLRASAYASAALHDVTVRIDANTHARTSHIDAVTADHAERTLVLGVGYRM